MATPEQTPDTDLTPEPIPLTLAELLVLCHTAWGDETHTARELLSIEGWLTAPGNLVPWLRMGAASLYLRGALSVGDDGEPVFADTTMAIMTCLQRNSESLRISAVSDAGSRHLAILAAGELPLLQFESIGQWAWGVTFREPATRIALVEDFVVRLPEIGGPMKIRAERRSTDAVLDAMEIEIFEDGSWRVPSTDESTSEAEASKDEGLSPVGAILDALQLSE